MSQNIIPELWAQGSFTAEAPFSQVVDPKLFYTVEATRTVSEMQALKLDLYKLVWQPVGISETEYQIQVEQLKQLNGAIITLTSKGGAPVYVPSTYMKSFPLVNGVIYEHVCLIADLGAVPPALKDRINSAIDHFNNYLKDMVGIENPRTVIGTIQTRGYVPKEQAEAWEKSREDRIKEDPSDLIRLNDALKINAAQSAYITELENDLKAKVTKK